MGLSGVFARFAAEARIPVFAVAGAGMRAAVQDLRLTTDIELTDSPREASILLVAGDVDAAHAERLARIHDLLPHPRATVLWSAGNPLAAFGGGGVPLDLGADPVAALRPLFRDLVARRRPSEGALLPDVDPVPWRGVGPYGQGGSGMTGGTPYGRPIAELGADRDELRLDVVPITVGPFFPLLPTGLVLGLVLAGDVIIGATVEDPGLRPHSPSSAGAAGAGAAASPFVRALFEPVPIAELEVARAREHLRWLANALHAHGLRAFAHRALRLSLEAEAGGGDRVRALRRRLGRSGLFRWSLGRSVALDTRLLADRNLGPVSRAAGGRDDVRLEDAAYRALEFSPVVGHRRGLVGTWEVRLEEAARSLEMAAAAGVARTALLGRVESPRGALAPGDSPTRRALDLVPDLLPGLEWGDAIAALTSLDLNLDEASAVAAAAVGGVAA